MIDHKTILIDPKVISSQDFELYFIDPNHQDKSPYFYYHAYKVATRYFRNLILAKDKDLQYTTIAKRQVIDKDCYKEHMSLYGPLYEKLEKYWDKYKQDHKDEFETYERVHTVKNDEGYNLKLEYTPDGNFSLEEAIQGYIFAKAKLEQNLESVVSYCKLPCDTYCDSIPRYSYRHHLLREAVKEKLGIPNASTYMKIESVPQIKRSLNTYQPESYEPFNTYMHSFSEFLLNC